MLRKSFADGCGVMEEAGEGFRPLWRDGEGCATYVDVCRVIVRAVESCGGLWSNSEGC